MIKVGEKVPDFVLNGINAQGQAQEYSLKDLLKGQRYLVLYFYPRDNTPGCTTEACDFRDQQGSLGEQVTTVGVSPDSVSTHQKFREKQGLNFPLLCDPDHRMLEAYQAWGLKKLYGKESMGVVRSTCLIKGDGTLVKHWPKVKVAGHVAQVLEAIAGA